MKDREMTESNPGPEDNWWALSYQEPLHYVYQAANPHLQQICNVVSFLGKSNNFVIVQFEDRNRPINIITVCAPER
jgi:hypothetical protein